MSGAAGDAEVTFRWETRAGPVTETFELETLTDGPEGCFVFLDTEEMPRVILKAEELADLQQRADAKVLGR